MGFISSDARHGGTLEQHQQPLAIAWSGVALVFLASAMGGFLYGYDIGATSFAMMLLLGPQEVRDGGAWWQEASRLQFRSSAWQQGLTVAAVSLGGMMGSHWAGCLPCVERLGRRMELRLAAICMATGACLNVASGTVLQTAGPVGFAALIAGRWVFGIGVGFVMRKWWFWTRDYLFRIALHPVSQVAQFDFSFVSISALVVQMEHRRIWRK